MAQTVLVVAPHPDDETLGCGGSLLRHRAVGDAVHWLIATETDPSAGFTPERPVEREQEIQSVSARYAFTGVHRLGVASTRLDVEPLGDLVEGVMGVFQKVHPEVVYVPYRDDVHSDHRVVFEAVQACCKSFRSPQLREVLAYETLSETGFSLAPGAAAFRPTLYVDVTPYLDEKIDIMRVYSSELGTHPFPRSERTIRALATLRGAECGCEAAEGFLVLKQIRT
jgi:LmbE family N-acetylglucosaminyl deacetylase